MVAPALTSPPRPGDTIGKPIARANDADSVFFYITDALFSARALIRDTGKLVERVTYDAYARPQHTWASDINGDGVVDQDDEALITAAAGKKIGESGYLADADLGRTGEVDATADGALWDEQDGVSTVQLGRLSSPTASSGPDNPVGFAGYMFNHETQQYHVRFRTYDPATGRWLQRDPLGSHTLVVARKIDDIDPHQGLIFNRRRPLRPSVERFLAPDSLNQSRPGIGYHDGMNLYQYVKSSPVIFHDPTGKQAVPPVGPIPPGNIAVRAGMAIVSKAAACRDCAINQPQMRKRRSRRTGSVQLRWTTGVVLVCRGFPPSCCPYVFSSRYTPNCAFDNRGNLWAQVAAVHSGSTMGSRTPPVQFVWTRCR